MQNNFYNIEYEMVLLGQMLLDNSIIDIVSNRLPVESFYDQRTRNVYSVILEEWKNNRCVSILTVCNEHKNISPSFISELTNKVSTSSNFDFFVRKINDCYISRKLKSDISHFDCMISPENISNVITEMSAKLSSYTQSGGNGSDVKELCIDIPKEMQERHKSTKNFIGFESGYENLDNMLEGFQTGLLYTVGARPSIGKTAFALNLLRNFGKNNIPATLLSLEMSAKACFYRLLAIESKLPLKQLKNGFCLSYKSGITKCMAGLERLYSYDFNIIDTDIDIDSVLYSRIRYEVIIKKKKIIFIDHLGLVEVSDGYGQRYLDVGKITKTLHKAAKELKCCIILLCQCGREAEGKKPNLSLLRESGNIENDSDVVMLIHRERDFQETVIPTTIIVAKNRDGCTGEVNFTFNTQTQVFSEEDKKEFEAGNNRGINEMPF